MKTEIKKAFEYNDILYEWVDGKVYRLSYRSSTGRYYAIRELQEIVIGCQNGYTLGRSKKTHAQIKDMLP